MAILVEPKKVAVMNVGFKANGMRAAEAQYYFKLPVVSAVMVQEWCLTQKELVSENVHCLLVVT